MRFSFFYSFGGGGYALLEPVHFGADMLKEKMDEYFEIR